MSILDDPLKPGQEEALTELAEALSKATDCGLLDRLLPECASGDSINDVCAAVAALEKASHG